MKVVELWHHKYLSPFNVVRRSSKGEEGGTPGYALRLRELNGGSVSLVGVMTLLLEETSVEKRSMW